MENTTTSVVPTIREHIVVTPGVCGGKPRIAGQRIKVQHVAMWHERMGLSPDEIVSRHPALTLGDVYAALSYYWDHRAEIDADLEADERFVTSLKSASSPSLLQEKLRTRDAQDDSLPSG